MQTWINRKSTIGLAFIVLGVLGVVGILALDIIRPQETGIGPAQRIGLFGCGALALVGIALLLVGVDRPASEARYTSSAEPSDVPRSLALIRRLLLIAAFGLMGFHLLVYVNYSLSLLSFPFDYDQGEGFELNDTILFSRGEWPYRPNAVYPFYASNYPPLYHVVLVPFVWLFGAQYWYGRLFGFLATLITSGAIGYAVHRETRHRTIAILSGLAFLASNYIYHIGPLFRQHISMVMLETLAVVTIAGINFSMDTPQRQRRLLLTGFFFLLAAGYTKQLAIATVGAVMLYLLLNIPRRAVLWGIGFAAVAGGIFLLINVSTGGQWWLNIITANVNEYILSQFIGLLRQFIGLHGALLIMAVIIVAYELFFDQISLYAIWFAAAAVDGILAGKWGAGDSYFSTMIAAMCILAGIFTARCLYRGWPALEPVLHKLRLSNVKFPAYSGQWLGLIACGLFVLYGLAVVKMPLDGALFGTLANALNIKSNTKFANFYDGAGWTMGYATIGQIPTEQDVANGWSIVNAVKDDPRPILSEEAAFSFHTGKPVVTNPTQLLNLYNNKHYDPSALVAMIRQQAFGAVIFRAGFYPEPVLDAVRRYYVGVRHITMNGYEYTILLPVAIEDF